MKSSWLDELASPDTGVRSRCLDALEEMGSQASSASAELMTEVDALNTSRVAQASNMRFAGSDDPAEASELSALSERISALWRGLGELITSRPDTFNKILASRPETVKWLGHSASAELIRLMCVHENNDVKQAGKQAAWWIGRK